MEVRRIEREDLALFLKIDNGIKLVV